MDSENGGIKRFTIRLKKLAFIDNATKLKEENGLFLDNFQTVIPSKAGWKAGLAADELSDRFDDKNSLHYDSNSSEAICKPPERSVLTCQFCAKSFIHNHMQHAFICHYRHNTAFCSIDKCEFESKFPHKVQCHIQEVHKSRRKPINKYDEHSAHIRALTKECFPEWLDEEGRRADKSDKKNQAKDGWKCSICSTVVKDRRHAAIHLSTLNCLQCKRCTFSSKLLQTMRKHYSARHKEFYWKTDIDTSEYTIAFKRIVKECFDRLEKPEATKATEIFVGSTIDTFDYGMSRTTPEHHKTNKMNGRESQEQPEIFIIGEINICPSATDGLSSSAASVRVKEEDELPMFLDRSRSMTTSSLVSSTRFGMQESENAKSFDSETFATTTRACSVTPEPTNAHSVKPEPECDDLPLSPALKSASQQSICSNGREIASNSPMTSSEQRVNSSIDTSSVQPVNTSVVAAVVALTQEIIAKQNQLMDILRTNSLFPSSE